MCGFIASINFKYGADKSILEQLKKINYHRGPDKINLLNKKDYSIIFRRLKIIDLSNRANQPFLDKNHGLKLIFNGFTQFSKLFKLVDKLRQFIQLFLDQNSLHRARKCINRE